MAGPAGGIPKIRTDLAYYAVVTRVISATQFIAAGLAGLGEGALVSYAAYVLAKVNGTLTPPHAEQPAITAYISSSGLFTHVAYTAPLAVGDQLLLLHPNISTAILGPIGNLAGLPPVTGSLAALWNSGVATSGNPGADLVTLGAALTSYKVHSLLVNISAFTVGATIRVRMFQLVAGVERQVYNQTFLQGTDPDGLWIINGTLGIHQALRVEIHSTAADDGVNCNYDCMLEAM